MLTQQYVKQLFDYDPLTGVLTWKIKRKGTKGIGNQAGGDSGMGYLCITIDGKYYLVHPIIWLWWYGVLPEKEIDHRNEIRHDNRLNNLREATHGQNVHNVSKAMKNSSSGIRGVCKQKGHSKYRAQIGFKGKQVYLGSFATEELAKQAYLQAKSQLHEFWVEK